jgi:hypothetical protein
MSKNVNKELREIFDRDTSHLNPNTLYTMTGTNSFDDLNNVLFIYLNKGIDDYKGDEDLIYLRRVFPVMESLILNTKDVNRKLALRKADKLLQKIYDKQIENKHKYVDSARATKELDDIRKRTLKLHNVLSNKESKEYELIRGLINETRNLDYLSNVFSKIEPSVNGIDKNGMSLFNNVVSKYLELVDDPINNKEDILYYGNVIRLMENQESFKLKDTDKKICLDKISTYLEELNKKDPNLLIKTKYLDDLKSSIVYDKTKFDMNSLANKHNIHIPFSEELMEEASLIPTISDKDRYRVGDYVVTIDGANACEIDDALSCKKLPNGNYLLGVHIASPLAYLPYESNLIEEARERRNTIYLPKKYEDANGEMTKVILLFPKVFSLDKASLLEKQERATRSYFFEISQDGEIVNKKFCNSITTSNKKATYQEVNDIINNGSTDSKLQETITNLNKVTSILDHKYKPSDIYLQIKRDKYNIAGTRVGTTNAEKMVFYSMLLTGNQVATWFYENNYPCLYRTHNLDSDDISKVQEMINNSKNNYGINKNLYQLLGTIYPKAQYGLSGRHDGLNLDHYCHITSELRRFPDIEVEHCLQICHDKKPSDQEIYKLEEEVNDVSNNVNSKVVGIDIFLDEYGQSYQKVKRR